MLKYLAFLPLLLTLLFGPSLILEPETANYMAVESFEHARIISARGAEIEAEAKARQLAVLHLVNYLERKWKQPRSELMEAVALSFRLTTTSSVSSSPAAWPQPLDVLAVMQVESGFNRQARDSQSGSIGLMQINSDDHKISQEKLVVASVSIKYGLALLKKYRREMLSESQALVAYNQGPVSATATCGKRRNCVTPYTTQVALAKQELVRHFN